MPITSACISKDGHSQLVEALSSVANLEGQAAGGAAAGLGRAKTLQGMIVV